MTVNVRDMRESDISALLPVHEQAFRGSVGTSIGRGYLHAFFRWYLAQPAATNLIAEASSEPVGYVFGAPHGLGGKLTRDLWLDMAIGVATHPRVILHEHFVGKIPARLLSMLSREPPRSFANTYALVGIGVEPSKRGLGIGARLVDEFEVRAASRGFERLLLEVYRENLAARALYESRGWRLAEENPRFLAYEKSLRARAVAREFRTAERD